MDRIRQSLATLARCFAIWGALVRNSFVRSLEFRLEFVGRAVVEVVWMGSQILTFQAPFRYAADLGGWTPSEMWFFIGTLLAFDGLYVTFMHPNQNQFGALLRNGQFDFYLIYPLPSLFLALFRFVNVHGIINVALGLGLTVWAATRPDIHVNVALWLLYGLLGMGVVAGLAMLVTTIGFWTIQNANLMWFFFELYRLGFRPESFYASWLRRILLSIFPAAFFFSVPVQLALGKLGGFWFVWPWLLVGVLMSLVAVTWRAGLKRYEGALS